MAEPLASPSPRRSFGERLVGAMKLDAAVYDEIEHDPTSMGQAAGVVVLAALATAIGGAGGPGAPGLVGGVIGSLLGWLASTAVVWLIGVRFMQHTSDYAELLRTLGFASAPRLLAILGFIPIFGFLVFLLAGILGLVAYVIAVRQALDVTTGRAILVCVLAYLVGAAVLVGLLMLVGAGVPSGPTA
jgi:hypothetical protein